MGLLTRGGTTYGNRTTAEIDALTGMSEGDTAYDTSLNRYRVYDGLGWVGDNIIVQKISNGLATVNQGNLVRPSNIANNEIGLPSTATGNYELICGSSISTIAKAQNTYCPMSYFGLQPVLYDGQGASVDPQEFVIMSTTTAGSMSETTATTGIFGISVQSLSSPGLVNVIFRGPEKS